MTAHGRFGSGGGPYLGIFVHHSPSVAESMMLADAGADYLCFDLQHGSATASDVLTAAAITRKGGPLILARVARNDAGEIGAVLDMGADGVIVPLVDTADDARRAVAACRYPADGVRSFGPLPATSIHGADYAVATAPGLLCFAMIETVSGLRNVDEIAGVAGVSGLYVGPADLSLSLGLPPALDHDDAKFVEAIASIRRAAEGNDIVVGMHAGPSVASRRVAQRFDLVTVTSDVAAFGAGLAGHLNTAREGSR